jgi:hypothetical protein
MSDLGLICLDILRIRDDFWVSRAEKLLGVCSPYVCDKNLIDNFNDERFLFVSTLYEIFPI